jgi:hypothetical protein
MGKDQDSPQPRNVGNLDPNVVPGDSLTDDVGRGVRTATTFTLIIEDAVCAAWAPINNTFTLVGASNFPTTEHYWNGILFQVGTFTGSDPTAMDYVEFSHGGNPVGAPIPALDWQNNLHWINVVPDDGGGRPAPMQPHHMGELRIATAEYSLRNYFRPRWGGITLWQPASGMHVDFEVPAGKHRNKITFLTRAQQFSVELYRDGVVQAIGGPVDTITIKATAGTDPGDDKNPPQQPGQRG